MPLAEETELIVRIGNWVLLEACRQAAQWPDLRCIAVNVSPVQFRRGGFVEQVQNVLQQTGLEPTRLEVEITEGVLLHETEGTLATLSRLRGIGVAIAMDDFGTGYSSLGYLRKFHFDKIKIDASFIRALGNGRACRGDRASSCAHEFMRWGSGSTLKGSSTSTRPDCCMRKVARRCRVFCTARQLSAADFGTLLAPGLAQRPALLALATVA